MWFNHLTVIHLRLCDRKKSLGASGLGLWWILRFAFAVNSCSGYGSTVVGSNCHQLAWSLAISRAASEVCDSRSWPKFKLDHSPLFSSTKLKKMAIAAVIVIWVPSDNKTGYLRDNLKLPDFSEQDFILVTVMCGYNYNSQRLYFLELNPYVDLCQITKLTVHPT